MTSGLSIRFRPLLTSATLFAVLISSVTNARPKPAFCTIGQPPPTISEQLAEADSAVLVQWVSVEKEFGKKSGTTTCQIQQVMKISKNFPKQRKITIPRRVPGKVGDQFVLFGEEGEDGKGLEWWNSTPMLSEAASNYISQAPAIDVAQQSRITYFLSFLESSDPVISNDAFDECANVDFKVIAQLTDQLPLEKIREWVNNPKIPATRLGLYGTMLGLCGTLEDAKLMEAKILVQTDEFRLGIDGLMVGYLLILKDKGLDVLDEHKLANKKVPFSETFAAMQALRFMWTYGAGKIAPARLQQSMRILLDRPEMADWVITDLARWKDWSIQDKLMAKYGEGEYNNRPTKRAIVRYMIAASRDHATGGVPQPAHAVKGQQLLDELRKRDPKAVAEAERFFVVP